MSGETNVPLHFEFNPAQKSAPPDEAPVLFTKPQVTLFRAVGPYTLFEVEGRGVWICHRGKLAQALLFEGFKKSKIESAPLLNPLPLTFSVGDPIESPLLKPRAFQSASAAHALRSLKRRRVFFPSL